MLTIKGWPVQVQAEYRDLFDASATDPEAVLRWRNRALRFVLPPDSITPNFAKAGKPDCNQGGKAGIQGADISLSVVTF